MSHKILFLDFGGCIDAPGLHPRNVYWEVFSGHYLAQGIDRETFQEAYTKADQQMMSTGSAKTLGLKEFNRFNMRLIDQFLGSTESRNSQIETLADKMSAKISLWIADSRSQLRELRPKIEMGIISNFTGNLSVILKEFDLLPLFSSVTESFHQGCSKPDPEIFLAALKKAGVSPSEAIYVGDNEKNDMIPAKKLGFFTVQIQPLGEAKSSSADRQIHQLREIGELL